MQEELLESAVCKCFSMLLPDLAEAGYQLHARQVTMINGRIDILLRRPSDGHSCIIELKAGSPPMPAVKDQILRYANAWQASFNEANPPRLMVISTTVPEATRSELRKFGIESRSISKEQVLEALVKETGPNKVPRAVLVPKDDIERIRDLLSNHEALMVPPGMVFAAPWDQLKICLALVSAGAIHKPLWRNDIGVRIYEQDPGCAVLYLPDTRYAKAPLHLNPRRSSWRPDVFDAMKPFIKYLKRDNKGPGKESQNFDHYMVQNWDGLASAIGLGNQG